MRIAVVYSTPTKNSTADFVETDVDTSESAQEVADALRQHGLDAFCVPITADHIELIDSVEADCIFDLIEWTGLDQPYALDAVGRLEKRGIPFTGATSTNYQKTADKSLMKAEFARYDIPTPKWQVFHTGLEDAHEFHYPVIIKPSLEHCSIGLTDDAIVHSTVELPMAIMCQVKRFVQPVVVEEFIDGREFQVTILEKEKGVWVLPAAEIIFAAGASRRFLTYESRWDETHSDYNDSTVVIADLSKRQQSSLTALVSNAFACMQFRDYSRFDMRLRGDDWFVLEANSNPGLGDNDEYGMTVSYKAAGMTFADFIWQILLSCLRRFGKSHSGEIFPVSQW